jgi:hypothetical protein
VGGYIAPASNRISRGRAPGRIASERQLPDAVPIYTNWGAEVQTRVDSPAGRRGCDSDHIALDAFVRTSP